MKLFLYIFLLYFSLNVGVRAQSKEDIQAFLKFIQGALEFIASKVHLHPDTGLTIEQFLEKYDYPLEIHNITTEDDYILSTHRIPHKSKKSITESGADKPKPVVLFVHGFASSAWDWLVLGPDTSLPFLLVDYGYDIWLANLRGNSYTSHKTLTRKDANFWKYSFHEKGQKDLPAIIDYILKKTGRDNLTLVGHSEGTTNAMVLTSTKPEYNKKINLLSLMAPLAYMGNATSPVAKILTKYENLIKLALTTLNIHGFSYNPLISLLADVFCNDNSSLQNVCVALSGILGGFDVDQINKTLLTVVYTHGPNGISVSEISHYLQEITSGFFRQYDYGALNLIHYGSMTPPSYDIKKITAPMAIYYAKNDLLSSVRDVKKFTYQLSVDTVDNYLVSYEQFSHSDFLLARDVKDILYFQVLPTILIYNPLPGK